MPPRKHQQRGIDVGDFLCSNVGGAHGWKVRRACCARVACSRAALSAGLAWHELSGRINVIQADMAVAGERL